MADGPMGSTCPVCGRYWNARGCTPGDCKSTPEPMAGVDGQAPPGMVLSTAGLEVTLRLDKLPGGMKCSLCGSTDRLGFVPGHGVGVVCPPCGWKVQHPPPWRWEGSDPCESPRLVDANGKEVLSAWTDLGGGDYGISIASPRVRALTEAAPEMEALLRRVLVEVDDYRTELRELLARIDERSKAGG